MSMTSKVIAITGGASGIGLATASLLLTRGAAVCIGDIVPSTLETARTTLSALLSDSSSKGEAKGSFQLSQLDVSKVQEVDAWIAGIVKEHGRLDGAANCAGVIGRKHGITKLTELEDEEWERIIGVNLTGLMYCLRAELRVVQSSGSIVNVSSIQGVMGFPGSAAYVASKHGVIGLTRSAAKEVGDREIRVNAVTPGSIMTPLLQKAQEMNPEEGVGMPNAIKRVGTAEEMAGIICFLLGPESTYVTGAAYAGDGGWNC
ncbi:NAD(P)-binding protein [Cadophora sp. DSE1049]|nr:NAD(P)-binding protein [Cadophora sp. DSE1049]